MVARSRLLKGAVLLVACVAAPSVLWAQSNPFKPASAASKAEVEKIIDGKLKEVESRLTAAVKSANATGPGVAAGAANAPGGPLAPGAPGAGINYPGDVPGASGTAVEPVDPIEAARKDGARFIGCINGAPKFVQKSGERLIFTKSQINAAIKDGILPACR